MKILIVDDDTSKYAGIIEELEKRHIEYEIIEFEEMKIGKLYKIDALILGMGEILHFNEEKLLCQGERILRCIETRGYRVETLIFSEIPPLSNYVFVRSRIEDWNTQKHRFFKFLESIKEPII